MEGGRQKTAFTRQLINWLKAVGVGNVGPTKNLFNQESNLLCSNQRFQINNQTYLGEWKSNVILLTVFHFC